MSFPELLFCPDVISIFSVLNNQAPLSAPSFEDCPLHHLKPVGILYSSSQGHFAHLRRITFRSVVTSGDGVLRRWQSGHWIEHGVSFPIGRAPGWVHLNVVITLGSNRMTSVWAPRICCSRRIRTILMRSYMKWLRVKDIAKWCVKEGWKLGWEKHKILLKSSLRKNALNFAFISEVKNTHFDAISFKSSLDSGRLESAPQANKLRIFLFFLPLFKRLLKRSGKITFKSWNKVQKFRIIIKKSEKTNIARWNWASIPWGNVQIPCTWIRVLWNDN